MGEKGRETIIANEESELQPGDVVEVVLRPATGMDLQSPAASVPAQTQAQTQAQAQAAP